MHSFEPGLATSNLNEVIFEIGRQFYGTEFTQLDPAERLSTVKACSQSENCYWSGTDLRPSAPCGIRLT